MFNLGKEIGIIKIRYINIYLLFYKLIFGILLVFFRYKRFWDFRVGKGIKDNLFKIVNFVNKFIEIYRKW